MTLSKRPLLCITGTTGSGKNGVGIRLAELMQGEVLSLDSMKVYRRMDVGTAKPSTADLARVKHHLIDILDPTERTDLSKFLAEADKVVSDRHQEDCPIIAVGGTAMYLTGLLFGVHDGPSRDDEFRAKLRIEREEIGLPALHARLLVIDPKSGEKINPNDYQRIERALEIFTQTGNPPSEQKANWFRDPRYNSKVYIVTWPRDVLRARIGSRIDKMFENGWVDEVASIDSSCGFSQEAIMALGYREIKEHLAIGGKEGALRERIKTKTWQFARRQLTWMTRYPKAERIVCSEGDDVESISKRIMAEFEPLWLASKP
ncbi:MAG: tRNA dimethylallyltransferase [Planctomycetota bacterium]|jgi:tRNA dimethylallyltransferase